MIPKSTPQHNIFIAAAMRSGSTHLKNCFVRMGWRAASLHITLEDNANEEHMVDARSAAVLFPLGGFVFQQHVRAIGRNVPILKEYGIKPVIMTRNLYDAVVSWKEQTDIDVAMGRPQGSHSPTYIPPWFDMSDIERLYWVAYAIAPWYLSFYASWKGADIDKIWLDYDAFYADQPAQLQGLCTQLGVRVPGFQESFMVTEPRTGKFNKGISGRGAGLPQGVKDVILRQACIWGLEEFCNVV